MIYKNITLLVATIAAVSGTVSAVELRKGLRGRLDFNRDLGKCNKCRTNNPCKEGGEQYHDHCDPNKYVQCAGKVCHDMDCAPGTQWDQSELTCVHKEQTEESSDESEESSDNLGSCGSCEENPCTDKNIREEKIYHEHCRKNKKYLQCGPVAGMCYERDCAPGTIWDQKKLTCVHEIESEGSSDKSKSPDKSESSSDTLGSCGSCEENPCTDENIREEKFYHKHCSKNKKYLQCGPEAGMCYEMDCAPGTMWDQTKLTCVHEKESKGSLDESSDKSKSPDKSEESSDDLGSCGSCEENPCTEENIEKGHFYHEHCSKNKKYLQCGPEAGMCYERDCAPGTVWSQHKQTCVHKKM